MALTRNGEPLTTTEQATLRAGIGGSVSQVAYSTVIPLDGDKVMPRTNIAGAVSLSIGAMVAGGHCRIPFVGNGANVPSITGAGEWATSFGFDNSAAGLLNVLDVWSDEGAYAYYAWTQPVTNGADTTPPTITGSSVANASPTVVGISFSEAMNTSAAPASSAFTVGGHTVSSVAWSGNVLNLTVTPAFVSGEAARTLAYAQPGANNLRDVAGNLLASVSGVAITNNVQPVDTTPPVLSTATVNGSSLVLAYNEALNTTSPAASAYSVVGAGGVTQTPSAVSISGSSVTLTLATPAVSGNTVTVSYTVPGSNPIRDTAGNPAAALTGQAVTNSTGAGDADFNDWVSRMTAAGGTASTTEKDAVSAFINTAKNGSTPFWSALTRANAFVNDANGSLVPFKIQSGSTNDTSPAATTVNSGGRTNASGTGYVNTQTPPPAAVGGLSVYLRDIQSFSPAATNVMIGSRDSGNTQVFRIAANLDGTSSPLAGSIQGAWGGESTAQSASATGAAIQVGHWHVQRNSSTSCKLRRNGAEVGTENTASTSAVPVSEQIYVFANNGGGTAGAFTKTPTSIGYYAILGTAMTDAQVAAYNTAVVALMTALNRNL